MADTSELFSQVNAALEGDDHARALELCDEILAAIPGDSDALHSKVVCNIQLGNTTEALQDIEAHADTLGDACSFERAYCLYNLQREEEAKQLLMPGGREPKESRELQLAGQIMYRQGDSARAAALFRQSEAVGGASSELSTNILAALVAAGQGEEALTYAQQTGSGDGGSSSGSRGGGGGDDDDEGTQFELFYNHACAAIAVGDLGLAKRLLGRAIAVCRDDCADLAEEEVEVELGVLTAQSAFVDQTLGDVAGAEKAYQTLFAFKAELDPAVSAVAANNMIRIRGEKNFFDSWKKCKANLSETLAKKLTPSQRLAFLTNGALLALHMNKPDQCKELLGSIESEFPSSEQPALIRAALLLRVSKQPKECEKALEAAAASASSPTLSLLALAQLQLTSKDSGKALETLRRVTALANSPGMVGTLVALHERRGEIDAAASCFESVTDPALIRASAAFFARHGRWPSAAAAHQKVLAANARDLEALAGLVIATSHYDPKLANEHYARLEMVCPPPDESDAEMIDAAELEQAALPKTSRDRKADERAAAAAAAASKRGAASEDAERRRPKKRRKKKTQYPKGYDAETIHLCPPPDPERWLPKRERSTYRKSKKEKRAGLSRGPQGSATGAARVDARATTNLVQMSDAEKAKKKAEDEAAARKEAAAEAAAAAGRAKKAKAKGKAKW